MHTKLAKKIFIVDDDAMPAAALADYLTRQLPHDIQIYTTGEEALQHIAEQPDIVILDYYLNSVDKDAANGMEILKEIKKMDHGIRVIMLSGQDGYGTALQSITSGAEEYVMKSTDSFEEIRQLCDTPNP